jgi:hypothetical protein
MQGNSKLGRKNRIYVANYEIKEKKKKKKISPKGSSALISNASETAGITQNAADDLELQAFPCSF